jgi:glycosyltransferase involved in cell wall biosynthesis
MQIAFSVIIPVCNGAAIVSRAIDSVLQQTYPPLEIVVVDDGSTDDTLRIVQAYGGKVRCMSLPHSGFVGAVRNRGILESRGSYGAFVDSDDAWHPTKLERMAEQIRKQPGAGLFYSDFEVVDEDGRFLCRVHCDDVSRDAYRQLLRRAPIATSTAVVRRDCFDVCGLFWEDVTAAEDWEMWIRIARQFPVAYVPLPLAKYTLHSKQPSLSSTEAWAAAQTAVVNRVLQSDSTLTERQKRNIKAWGYYHAGRFRIMRGQNEQARLSFRKGIQQDPCHWRSWLFFAFLFINSLVQIPDHWWRRFGLSAKRNSGH